MEYPFFSVITICKNSEDYIQECLTSIKNQSFKDYEHIICDGNSTDGTIEIINKNKKENTKLFIENDKGLYYALNKGIAKCSGKYIVILHSDDKFFNNNVLENLNKEIISNDFPIIIIANIVYVNSKGAILRRWRSDLPNIKKIQRGWMAPHTGLVISRKITNLLGPYDTNFRISADYAYELKLFQNYTKNIMLSKVTLTAMKLGGLSNRNIKSILRKTFEDFKVMRRNEINPFFGIFFKNFSKIKQFWGEI